MRRWVCARCGSSNVSVAVEWAESVEPVDHALDELAPVGSGPGDIARILRTFCNACEAEGSPEDGLRRRVALSAEQAADADAVD